MATTVHDILTEIRETSETNVERGTRFENLMVSYLRSDPAYADRFDQVWRWTDWPGNGGKGDTGIDLVAKLRDEGGYCAVQCKFYEPDHTLNKGDIDSFFTASGKAPFTERLIISTTDKWGKNAEEALDDQQLPVSRIGLADIDSSPVNWDLAWSEGRFDVSLLPLEHKKELRPHQQEAVDAVFAGFSSHQRGKLIMACGTGKTFTSLKIAERLAAEDNSGEQTRVLFLVPSISLLSQTLREWTAQCSTPLRSFAVCSDSKVSRRVIEADGQDIGTHDLAFPATTDVDKLLLQMSHAAELGGGTLSVIFSTYQSISVVAAAQQAGLPDFDMIICDEAHRTTGVTLAGQDESQFVKVHDNSFIRADRRLYMTATPRLFSDDAKTAAQTHEAVLASMDDEELYGPEFHRLGFGKAVSLGLLTDYKVLILTIDEEYVARSLQGQFADENFELKLGDAAKIVGCWNGLAKRSAATGPAGEGAVFKPGEPPMRRAVAFARNIAESQEIAHRFQEVISGYEATDEDVLRCEVEHVDGTFNSLERNKLLDWLKADPGDNNCRILSNARCLSEGVDVPDLDAVLFLNPRNSTVDVVQSVGRVMRKAEGKDFGYIILPVGIPAGVTPERALADNQRFKVVWQVLNALRAHDDRFNAKINQLDLNKQRPDTILTGHVGPGEDGLGDGNDDSSKVTSTQLALSLDLGEWRDAIYAKIVSKVGERHYWEDWAKSIAVIAERHVARIRAALDDPAKHQAFEVFLGELRASLNPNITEASAIDMLAQHLITKPVFDALFAGYAFSERNPVSQAMQQMLDKLEDQVIGKEAETLESFYESVRVRAEGIDNHEGRQQVITELYERFFKTALPKTADAFGIVYTPIPVVDFILRATDQALAKHFGVGMSDEGVHIIDPFTGTGTFMVRLLQSGLIKPEDLLRKYTKELHANEILLLAYYIAAVNIEAAFHQHYDGDYRPFEGIVLADTFQLSENDQQLDLGMLIGNSERALRQKRQDIRVIIGNPPYSVGQDSQNDNNQNQRYQVLDGRIRDTYAAKSTATNKNSLYDSYIRAIRWASDRVKDEGVICYVSNGGYIDGNTADGLRKTLSDDFDAIYCYNLRGNQRTAGELSRQEGGKIFGSGSRSTVAILLLVKGSKNPDPEARGLHYRDIGDYLSRADKLAILSAQDLNSVDWQHTTPSPEGDWINQRDPRFAAFRPLSDKNRPNQAIFCVASPGLQSNRDAWVYNSSKDKLRNNARQMIKFYNEELDRYSSYLASSSTNSGDKSFSEFADRNPTLISWSSSLLSKGERGHRTSFTQEGLRKSIYRPFNAQHLYFDGDLNHRTGKLKSMFPTQESINFGFYVTGLGSDKPFSVCAVDQIPDLAFWGSSNGQFFSRYTYRETGTGNDLFTAAEAPGFEQVDNVTDVALADYRRTYGEKVTKDDIFFYVYGLLHSPTYRSAFAADLKKSLPRIPKVADFHGFAEAGRRLANLHIGYESVEPYPLDEVITGSPNTPTSELYRVEKMKFRSKSDRTALVYNSRITLAGIPEDVFRYQLGARSALEWIIDRYQVKKDKASGIVNDPNDWSDDPRYIVDLVKRIITVGLETIKIVDSLPPFKIIDQ
ncbi:DEAD/DEAH box helicase [Spirillospora sp. NPDC050679]